jgi:hypothetical protein
LDTKKQQAPPPEPQREDFPDEVSYEKARDEHLIDHFAYHKGVTRARAKKMLEEW